MDGCRDCLNELHLVRLKCVSSKLCSSGLQEALQVLEAVLNGDMYTSHACTDPLRALVIDKSSLQYLVLHILVQDRPQYARTWCSWDSPQPW